MPDKIVLKKGLTLNCYLEGTISAMYTNHSEDITIKVDKKFGYTYLCIIDFSSLISATFVCTDYEIEGEE